MSLSVRACCVFLLIVLLAAPDRVAATNGEPDPVRVWNELALYTARTVPLSDAQSARLYAMVNAAMFDAVNGILFRRGRPDSRNHALVPVDAAPPNADIAIAAAAAAHAVLAGEHPSLISAYNQELDSAMGF